MKKIIYWVLPIIAILFVACDDMLKESPKALMAPDNFWKTESDAVAGVYAIFSPLANGANAIKTPSSQGVFALSFPSIISLTTDEVYTDPIGPSNSVSLSNLAFNYADGDIDVVWRRTYQSINRANDAIANIPNITMDTLKRKRLIGQAKFLRAFNYFNLVRLFGGVPYRSTPTSDIKDANSGKSSELEIYQNIIVDLTSDEVASLPLSPAIIFGGTGAVPKVASNVLLAKVYMTMAGEPLKLTEYNEQNIWQLALDEINKVTGFSLYNNYNEAFLVANENKLKENIFEIQFKSGYGDLVFGYGNLLGQQSTPKRLPGAAASNDQVKLFDPLARFLPTPMLYDAFEAGDKRRDMIRFSYKSSVTNITYTISQPGFMWKYVDENAMLIHNKNQRDDDMNFRVYRYADVLLMKAEVINELNNGPTVDAYNAINEVRTRAFGLANPKPLSGLDYVGFKNAVIHERFVELWFEGHRWFDLKRWGKLEEVMSGLKFIERGNNTEIVKNFNSPQHLYFPIPENEMLTNKALTPEDQNAGW